MRQKDVANAFELLLAEVAAALKAIREEGAQAFRRGDSSAVRALATRADAVESLLTDLRTKRKQWDELLSASPRPQRPQQSRQYGKRLPKGVRTPARGYRIPILRALTALAGEARAQDVLDRVYADMKGGLKSVDLQRLPSGNHMPRWRNAALWERVTMVEDGLLRNDSPRGTWAITERGRTYLREQGGER